MNSFSIQGGRMARLLDESGEAWYHVYNRVAGEKERMLFDENLGAKEALCNYIEFYASAYCCEVATYVVMGNHFHIIVRMKTYDELSREELEEKVRDFYPNTFMLSEGWTDEHWEHFNRRLFNLSDLMRNIQQGFARWFNKSFKRRGRFWADRFKSTLLYGERSLIECMQYVDLNPIRAGLVEIPEDYACGAFAKRSKKNSYEFLSLKELMGEPDEMSAFEAYRANVYLRGGVATKEGQKEMSSSLLDDEIARNFNLGSSHEHCDHFRFYLDGLVIGMKDNIEKWLCFLREKGIYRRRKNPVPIRDNLEWFSIREQRSNFESG